MVTVGTSNGHQIVKIVFQIVGELTIPGEIKVGIYVERRVPQPQPFLLAHRDSGQLKRHNSCVDSLWLGSRPFKEAVKSMRVGSKPSRQYQLCSHYDIPPAWRDVAC